MNKRGRKPGQMTPGSYNDFLSTFERGDYAYIETTAEGYASTMRTINTPRTRRPPALDGREFTCALYRGIGAAVDDVRVLVRIERTE